MPEIKICQTIVSTSTKEDTWTLQPLRTRKLQKFNCRRLHADTHAIALNNQPKIDRALAVAGGVKGVIRINKEMTIKQ
ncbi:hypothetical protein [Rhodoferax sp.]|uniref:hypothetical protein n=1 Tax=Rhodoferax sp. TaxID=50421 RepID=UPI003BB5BBC2